MLTFDNQNLILDRLPMDLFGICYAEFKFALPVCLKLNHDL